LSPCNYNKLFIISFLGTSNVDSGLFIQTSASDTFSSNSAPGPLLLTAGMAISVYASLVGNGGGGYIWVVVGDTFEI